MPTLMLVPTGIGCDIGGYAGDALPSARLLAAASGCLITHPNVMNGASLYWSDSRVLYVEGYALDRFAVGEAAGTVVGGSGCRGGTGELEWLRSAIPRVAASCNFMNA